MTARKKFDKIIENFKTKLAAIIKEKNILIIKYYKEIEKNKIEKVKKDINKY